MQLLQKRVWIPTVSVLLVGGVLLAAPALRRGSERAELMAPELMAPGSPKSSLASGESVAKDVPMEQSAPANAFRMAPPPPASAPITEIALKGSDPEALRPQPQLIKNADIVLRVKAVEESMPQIRLLLLRYQGDLLSLQEASNGEDVGPTSAYVQLRVPQARLEALMTDLDTLGDVRQRSITAEDVSDQLVDYQARLRTLRRTEESVLGILNRSGNITQVLEVTRELNSIRTQIEQIAGQQKKLQDQVAYSHVNVQLEERIPIVLSDDSLATRLAAAWEGSTASLVELGSQGLIALVWILVYSPLLILPAGGAVLLYKGWRHRSRAMPS